MKTEVRIDKWLWAVRLFKTRTLAADACKKGKVVIQNVQVKPSRNIKVGEVVSIKRNPILFSFKVLALSENRMNAKLVVDFMLNVTTPDQLELIELAKLAEIEGPVDQRRKSVVSWMISLNLLLWMRMAIGILILVNSKNCLQITESCL